MSSTPPDFSSADAPRAAAGRLGNVAPFFEAPPVAAPAERRILLISFHFPPSQAVGALRWQMLAHFAAERGWGLDVVTASPESLESSDPKRLGTLPPGTRVFGAPLATTALERIEHVAWNVYRRLRPRRSAAPTAGARDDAMAGGAAPIASVPRAPTSLAREEIRWSVGDPRQILRVYYTLMDRAKFAGWAMRARSVAAEIVQPGTHRVVIGCGPPHEANEAAWRVARAAGLPWVMDMRDPWRLIERLPEPVASPLKLWYGERGERRAARDAALVICNTEPARRALADLYPDARARYITVMNGYDEERVPRARRSGRFTIAYAGSIYIDRDPRLLFRAAARVIADLALTPARFGFDFIGNVEHYDGVPVSQIAREEGIQAFVTSGPSRPRAAMLDFLAGAAMLVSLPQDSDLAIPSKIFEYMLFDAWLLVLATPGSATEQLLRDTGADVAAPKDVDAIAAALRARYLEYASGVTPTPIARDERFSRRSQARVLLDALDEVTGGGAPAGSERLRVSRAAPLV
ncbi:MAG: hypothetical protein WKG32_14295 [Gemmatimonadaceae bacterium]